MMKNKFSVRLVARLYRFFRRKVPGVRERILIVSTTGLGDTLWSLPATLSLRKSFPKAQLFFLTGPFGKELFKQVGLDGIVEVPTARGLRRLRVLPHLYRELKALKLDTILFFHVQPTYALIGFLTGANTYGNPKKVPPATLTHPFPFTHETEHLISHRLRMIKALGANPYFTSLHLDTDTQITQQVKAYLKGGQFRIGLCIGSQDAYKIWSPEQFGRLAQSLEKELGASVALIGSSSEKSLASKVLSIAAHATDLTGRFSVKELIHFIDGLDLIVSNDTGPAHIAYALATPCITLFSPTDSEQNGPYHPRGPVRVVQSAPTCLSCITTACRTPLCMRVISTGHVLEKIKELLDESAAKKSSSESSKLLHFD